MFTFAFLIFFTRSAFNDLGEKAEFDVIDVW